MTVVASEAVREYLERHAGGGAWRWSAEDAREDMLEPPANVELVSAGSKDERYECRAA